MDFDVIFVLVCIVGMLTALIMDIMRPGMILLSIVVLLMCAGILTPKEMLEGFSNKGMITVAMLFLVSEGVRQSGALNILIKRLLPQKKVSVFKAQIRILPTITFISAFLNNTPVVVIFAPIIKRWAEKMKMQPTKLLIPLSYATILGGICTLIGTSTNLVVHGMILDAGYKGFSMFELGKVGIIIAIAGLAYMFVFSNKLLPDSRKDQLEKEEEEPNNNLHKVEVIIGARFPGIKKTLGEFDFHRHYGAYVKEVRRAGESYTDELDKIVILEGDTLVLWADDSFIPTWGDSRVFWMVSNGKDNLPKSESPKKRMLALALLIFMIAGATIGELPFMQGIAPGMKFDMFFFVCITTMIMAWTKLFPPKKYTKYISWDILVTIACAFAISKAMNNSGVASLIAKHTISMADSLGPQGIIAVLFIITNIFTELITNNAAAALSFPIALAVANQLHIDPTPFFVVICMAASSSYSTPIGYQTNLIVQGIGGYKFTDFLKIGLPLNVISFLICVFLIPLIWN